MNPPNRIVLRDDPTFSSLDKFMKFHLHYEGPLYSGSGEARDGQVDKRGGHKHDVRRAFHKQLKHWWDVCPAISNLHGGYDILGFPPEKRTNQGFGAEAPLFKDVLAEVHDVGGNNFVPLVCKELSVLCGIDILMLRRDRPGGILQSRDIDNRLKVLFDALRMPSAGSEIAQCTFADDEKPMFVLLQDDNLISSVSVETDELLDPPQSAGEDDGFVRLLLTVDIRPYNLNMFNMVFG